MQRSIPHDLVLGAATAAYQIEGAAAEDGRTPSIWDAFSRVPGAVIDAHNGDVACDHYHRMPEDVAMMRELGLQTYRFSTSWARVCPDGGAPNAKGLDFYSRLVDELLDADILPWLTLYHWDLPQTLEEAGGWPSRDTAHRFVDYALAVHERLGDRVQNWTTLNEPWCSSFLSYIAGAHAPGRQSVEAGLQAGHHLLLAHGMAVQALRDAGAERLGITLNFTVADPVDPSSASDLDAARRIDEQYNRFFVDPILRGCYPETLLADVGHLGLDAVVQEGDLAIIASPIDVLGVNYYHGDACSFEPPAEPMLQDAPTDRAIRSPFPAADGVQIHPRGLPVTTMGWEVQPDGLTRLLTRLHEEYAGPKGVELWVTENGAAYDDEVVLETPWVAEDAATEADGADASTDQAGTLAPRIHDPERVDFLRAHVGAVLDAIDAGVPVKGYMYWSLMDNYEWAWGYHKRFGIVRVDYDTQERTVKDSGLELARMIRERTL
ncbi:glycoside hydrolase family 1 protein [Agrococcus beijingensis]|uniref:glycoside hydrolase family 1 protein n=1 Tax=Agrococcus beijingensis TaxID=3068634 RepID=UPI0027428293|nr:family 1 glycosylhydrolase [Agrococcus sp. REN33]